MLLQNYVPVTEAYFGKTKNLMEVEKLIGKIIRELTVDFKDVGKRIINAPKINKSKENKQIEALLCKEFGFKEMILHWDGSPTLNAWTVTHGIIKLADGSEPTLPIKSGEGKYYDSKHKYICVVNIYAGFIDAKTPAEEIVACILHEIGHNFACTPVVNVVSMLEWAFLPINLYRAYTSLDDIFSAGHAVQDGKHNPDVAKDLEKCKEIGKNAFIQAILAWFRFGRYWDLVQHGIFRVFQSLFPDVVKAELQEMDEWIVNNKNKVLAEWKRYMDEIEKLKEYYKKNPSFLNFGVLLDGGIEIATLIFWHDFTVVQHFLSLQEGYSNEVFADSFASAYGYGAATVALQRRIEYYVLNNRALAKTNEYNVYNQYIFVMSQIMTTFLDEHPASQTRMKNQIDKLKRDLADDDVDPRIRKELMKDLERAEKIYNEYLNNFPPELKHLAVVMNYNQLNEMYFGGKFDLREPINRVLNFGKAEA